MYFSYKLIEFDFEFGSCSMLELKMKQITVTETLTYLKGSQAVFLWLFTADVILQQWK